MQHLDLSRNITLGIYQETYLKYTEKSVSQISQKIPTFVFVSFQKICVALNIENIFKFCKFLLVKTYGTSEKLAPTQCTFQNN